MAKIVYIEKRFSTSSQELIDVANEIIAEYERQGFKLTLRQLYYQFVARDHIPNRQSEYKRLGGIISDARLAGLIDWDAIEDRGRNLITIPSWQDPESIIQACAHSYQIDLWKDQDYAVEVWVEKEALIGVIGSICEKLRVPHYACRGYVSQSEMHDAGRWRLHSYLHAGRTPVILHLGDHDPSGLDMTRDIAERLQLFAGQAVEIKRLALNWDQIEEFEPPPNPAKSTDSRFAAYVARFGDESWELDALPPEVLASLIEEAVSRFRDQERWDYALDQEREQRKVLTKISSRYDDVRSYLNGDE